MAKPEWGAKHICASCGAKFYDMGRDPVTCPGCETPLATAAPSRSRRARKDEAKAEAVVEVVAEAKETPEAEDEILTDDVDDLIEDDDEDDAIVALADDDEDDEDDLLVEADISKNKIADE